MTFVRLGYVAMSIHLPHSSPSQTMTFAQFSKIQDRDAAIRKLERISRSNLANCLRLLKYNVENGIYFFRFSSRLIPLATHDALSDWDYLNAVAESLAQIGEFLRLYPHMRIDFHPDHFVLLNSTKKEVFIQSLKTLAVHRQLLQGMNVDPTHRCVLHIGGGYGNKEKALEQFIENWGHVDKTIQPLIMLENDDKIFTVQDTLYLCEKLGIPMVLDLHHHYANYGQLHWEEVWDRIVQTWHVSFLPVKIHISSPRSETQFRAHADYIDPKPFCDFLERIKGTVDQVDVMIEAKRKDEALFQLIRDLKQLNQFEWENGASFYVK